MKSLRVTPLVCVFTLSACVPGAIPFGSAQDFADPTYVVRTAEGYVVKSVCDDAGFGKVLVVDGTNPDMQATPDMYVWAVDLEPDAPQAKLGQGGAGYRIRPGSQQLTSLKGRMVEAWEIYGASRFVFEEDLEVGQARWQDGVISEDTLLNETERDFGC